MARRGRRKSNPSFFKQLNKAVNFKIPAKTRKRLYFSGFITTLLFIAFVLWYPHPERPRKAPAPKKKITQTTAPRPAAKPAAKKEPVVYYKKTAPVPPPAYFPKRVLTGAPKIAFVIDDIGNTNHHVQQLESLGSEVTYAILPLVAHSEFFGRLSQRTGAAVILHLPMESAKGTIPGPGLITSSMDDEYVLERLRRDLDSVPYLIGVNNHMGSKGTSDPRLMSIILSEVQSRGLFFLDSGTTPKSVIPSIARQKGMRVFLRDEFLDNVDSVPAVREEVRKLAEIARRKGLAIGICHYRPNTLQVLNEEIPKLKAAGFQVVNLRDLL